MAKAKTKSTQESSAQSLSTAATVHGIEAAGARLVKKGFSFSDAQDLQFALGWPHLYELAEGHPDDADPAASAFTICREMPTRSVWGRATAHRVARGITVGNPSDMKGNPRQKFVDAAGRSEPIGAAEASAMIAQLIQTTLVDRLAELLLFCEAIVGPDAVVAGALDGLAKTPSEIVAGHSTNRGHLPGLLTLGLILLRLRTADRDAALARWKTLYKGWKAAAGDRGGPILAASEDVLTPKEAKGYPIEGPLLVVDDPGRVAAWRDGFKGKPTNDDVPDPRFVFLGGESVYENERASWAKYPDPSTGHPAIVERFGRVRSPTTVALMKEMAEKSKAKKAAAAWLIAHAGSVG